MYDFRKRPQVSSIGHALRGRSFERPDSQQVHYRAIFDDTKRMLAILCHNSDLADGWERAGANEYSLREFSEKRAYPMGINIVFYALTR